MLPIKKQNISPILTDILTEWLVRDKEFTFFGHLSLVTNIQERRDIPTMGVWISHQGFNLGYNRVFIEKLSKEELMFVIIHEFMHLISKHYERTVQFNLIHKLANIAQDMIINTEIIEQQRNRRLKLPEGGFTMPPNYDDLRISELVYEYLQSDKFKKEQPQENEKIQSLLNDEVMDCSNMSDDELNDLIDKLMKNGQFDVHMENEVSEEVARNISKGVTDSLKLRGLVPSNIENYLQRITPRKKDYISKIKRAVNGITGGLKYDTYKRMNRRSIPGKKGFLKEGLGINVLLDVSGSMGGLIEYVLGYCFQNNLLLNVLQVDAVVQKVEQFKSKNDLSKIKIKGYGGTELQPGINYVVEHKELQKLNTLILTDGYCDNLDFTRLPGKKIIISVGAEVIFRGNNVTQIIVDPKDVERDMKSK